MVLAVPAADSETALRELRSLGEDAWRIGQIVAADDVTPASVRYAE